MKLQSKNVDSVARLLPWTIFIGSLLFYLSYFVLYWKLFSLNRDYVNYIHIGVQILIALFLILRFHPFRHHVLENGDSAIIFSAALFLLASLGVTQYMYYVTADHLKDLPVLNTMISNGPSI